VEIKVLSYDTKSDPSRVPQGYVWLKGRGAVMMSSAPMDAELLRSSFEQDGIPFWIGASALSLYDSEWLASIFGAPESEHEILMEWVMDNWDYDQEGRSPKIGFIGLAGVPFYEGQLDKIEEICAENPDKLEWLAPQMAPTTTKAWALEISRLKESDWIVVAMSGSFLASFIAEARARGYENQFMGPYSSVWGFWELVREATSVEDLDGVVTTSYFPWWSDTGSFIVAAKEYIHQFFSPGEAASLLRQTGPITGWAMGMVLVDTVRRAVENVGAENVDGTALREALLDTDMTEEGWGNPWRPVPGNNVFAKAVQLYQYRAAEDDWFAITEWEIPPSLGG